MMMLMLMVMIMIVFMMTAGPGRLVTLTPKIIGRLCSVVRPSEFF